MTKPIAAPDDRLDDAIECVVRRCGPQGEHEERADGYLVSGARRHPQGPREHE